MQGTKFCGNCIHYNNEGHTCSVSDKAVVNNVFTDCKDFDGELKYIDWDKATPIGYRPSTFS